MAKLLTLTLCMAPAAAFVPMTRTRLPVLRNAEPATATVEEVTPPEPAAEEAAPAVAETPPLGDGTSNFTPRPVSEWAEIGAFQKYKNLEQSIAYGWLSRQMEESPVPVDFLQPYVDMTKKRPKMLDGTHAGDYGFDPMSYANTDELLYFYMESEVKHARLAMLGCLGWIAGELSTGTVAPNILNGQLFQIQNFAFTAVLFGLWSWNEHIQYPAQYLEHTPNVGKNNYQHYEDGPYVAGTYEFDPLNLYKTLGDDAAGRRSMRDLELGHGRVAMLAITSWFLFETVTQVPILDFSPIFFKPFWHWGLPFLGENGVVGTVEFAAVLGAIGYSAYNAVANDFDSIKYLGDNDEKMKGFKVFLNDE